MNQGDLEHLSNLHQRLYPSSGVMPQDKVTQFLLVMSKCVSQGSDLRKVMSYLTKKKKPLSRRNISNLRYADDTTLIAESEEELKSLLMKVKQECEKAGLKQHQKTKSWHPVSSLHGKYGGKQWLTLFFWAPKSLQMAIAAMKLKDAYTLEEKL